MRANFKLKAHLVSAEHLVGVATRLDWGSSCAWDAARNRSGGRSKGTLLSDAIEAVIAVCIWTPDWKKRATSSSGRFLEDELETITAEGEANSAYGLQVGAAGIVAIERPATACLCHGERRRSDHRKDITVERVSIFRPKQTGVRGQGRKAERRKRPNSLPAKQALNICAAGLIANDSILNRRRPYPNRPRRQRKYVRYSLWLLLVNHR